MAEAAAVAQPSAQPRSLLPLPLLARVAWRNLGRRRLRTAMSAAGIGFAILLVSTFTALQTGVYGAWIDTATGVMTGHWQAQHPAYQDDPRIADVVPEGTALAARIAKLPGVVGATPRAEAFALVSAGERSFGGLVHGVLPGREAELFSLPARLIAGDYLPREDSAYLGAALAANLGVGVGDEIVALGGAPEGGVAALALTVDGIFASGQAELDRSLLQVPLAALQQAFGLGDGAHRIVINAETGDGDGGVGAAIAAALPSGVRLLDWQTLMPQIEQSIRFDRITADMIYWLLMLLVALSVVNAFMMTVFERTPEFGMLLAIGMRPTAIVGMLLLEGVGVWALGALCGLALCVAVVLPLQVVGFALPENEALAAMNEQMMMPERLHPALGGKALAQAPLVMLIGTLFAALVPALRVRRMRPVEALRAEE